MKEDIMNNTTAHTHNSTQLTWCVLMSNYLGINSTLSNSVLSQSMQSQPTETYPFHYIYTTKQKGFTVVSVVL
jgi:hypothetical protein